MIPKTKEELAIMAEGGKKLGNILQALLEKAKPGVTLTALEQQAAALIREAGGTPSFTTVPGYKWATCLCVNEVVVHGIPTDYALKDGDKLNIDIGMVYKGFHTDTAWTKIIGSGKKETEKFLAVGEEALWKAIDQAKVGNRIGHISQTIQTMIEAAGYSVVPTLTGHGVGRQLHEAPQVPGILKGSIDQTPELIEGQTIAIEVIYAQGRGDIVYENDDGWTLATRDRSLSAVFEHTIVIGANGPIVLTRSSLSAPQGEPSIK